MGIFSGGEKGKSLKASTVEKSVHSRPWGDERIMSGKMWLGKTGDGACEWDKDSRSLGRFPRDREGERRGKRKEKEERLLSMKYF